MSVTEFLNRYVNDLLNSPPRWSEPHDPTLDPYLVTPLTGAWVPLYSIVGYLVAIFCLEMFMRRFHPQPIKLDFVVAIHNFFLSGLSLYMASGVFMAWRTLYAQGGLYGSYCGVQTNDDARLMNWGMVFYLSKYYELLDTVFLVLRRKPLTFLHVYHHASVVFVCWSAVHGFQVMGIITVINNATVHVFMYFYFAVNALGYRPRAIAPYLTRLQIMQFVIDLVTALPYIYIWYYGLECRGNIRVWSLAFFTGWAFFFLFVAFFKKRYKGRKSKKKSA